MDFTRRHLLRFGGSSIMAAMALSACGGDDGAPEPEPDVITAEGAERIEHVPDAEPIDRALALMETQELIAVKVFFGNQAQAFARVNVYDVNGALLASGTTEADGYFHGGLPGKRVLFASAELASGDMLYGYSYAPDGIVCPAVNVNAYQTLAAHMARTLSLDYNIINFLLHRQYAIGFNEEIQSIDIDNAEFSQAKFAQAQRDSGLSVEGFMDRIARSIVANIDEEVDPTLAYAPTASDGGALLLPGIDDATKYQMMEFALSQLEKLTKGFVNFPYSDDVIGFFFGKIKGELIPAKPDPLAEIKEKLNIITGKLDAISKYLKEHDLTERWNTMLRRWSELTEARKDFNSSKNATAAAYARDKALRLFENLEFEIKSYNSWFFGGGLIKPENSFLYLYSQFIAELPYYSADVQDRVDTYVANFVLRQSEVLGFAMAMVAVKNKENGVSEEITKAELALLQESLKETERLAATYRLQRPVFPDTRLLVHKDSKTLWTGLCGTVERVVHWMPPGYYTRMWHYVGVQWPGEGVLPNGVDHEIYMLKNANNPNGVERAVLDFASWKIPSKGLVERAFTHHAKAAKKADKSVKAFDVFAQSNGIPAHFPVRQWDLDKKQFQKKFAVIGTSTFIGNNSNGFCWEQDFVRLDDYGSYRGALSTKYQDGARYAYFPYADMSDEQVKKCDLRQIYTSFFAAAFTVT